MVRLEQVREHRQRSLGPAALTIVVAGDADPEALAAAAAAGLAGWSGLPGPTKPPALAPTPRRAIHRVARPGLAQAVVVLAAPPQSPTTSSPPGSPPTSSRSTLGERLRDDMAATYGVELRLEPARGPGLVHVLTQVDAAAVGRALNVLRDTLARLHRHDLAPALVHRVCIHEALERLYRRHRPTPTSCRTSPAPTGTRAGQSPARLRRPRRHPLAARPLRPRPAPNRRRRRPLRRRRPARRPRPRPVVDLAAAGL